MRIQLIQTERTLKPYFKEMVEHAVYNQHLDVTSLSQFYIVNMLDEFSRTEQLFAWKEGHHEETPLAILLKEALASNPSRRIKTFKKLGDLSLYIAGYFSDHVDSKQVDMDYYISMGEGAYKNLAGILAGEKMFQELYDELSAKFIGLMGILSEIRHAGGAASNSELVRLYEKWLKTGDEHIKTLLEKEGIKI